MYRVDMTPEQAAAVLRRAAELQAADLGREDALDTAAVVQLGRELGLREDAVRSALAEHRAPVATSPATRVLLGLDAEVLVGRHVAASPQAAQAHVGRWLEQQWLQRCRTRPQATSWRPRRGVVADLRRGLDMTRTLQLEGVAAVEVRTEPDGLGTRVDVAVSLSDARTEALGLLVALPTGMIGTIGVVAALLTGPEALVALPVAGAAGGAGWLGARAHVGSRRRQVAEAVEGVLDALPAR